MDQVTQMIRKAFQSLSGQVPVRTSRCIPLREVPEVYHMFMDILHCFIFSKVFILIGGVPLDLVYVDAVIILSSSKESIR